MSRHDSLQFYYNLLVSDRIPDRSTDPYPNITENKNRHERGPVQNISSVTCINKESKRKKSHSCIKRKGRRTKKRNRVTVKRDRKR